MQIIDFHTHLGGRSSGSFPDKKEEALGKLCSDSSCLLQRMDGAGIDKSVVFTPPMISHTQREINYGLLDIVKGNARLIPFAFLDPRLPESPALLEELIEKGVCGLKLSGIHHGYIISHPMCHPTYEIALQHQIPLIIHTGWGEFGEIKFVVDMAKQFKELRIVIAHMIEYKDIFNLAPPYSNVSVETSYSSHPRRIAEAVNLLGADRIVFGSDFPCSEPAFELYKVVNAPLSDGDKEKILYKNAERLLRRKTKF